MFSKDLELTIGQCYKSAREQRHEFMTVEHLLLALLDNASATTVLRACNVDLERLREALDDMVDQCSGSGSSVDDCPIVEVLFDGEPAVSSGDGGG